MLRASLIGACFALTAAACGSDDSSSASGTGGSGGTTATGGSGGTTATGGSGGSGGTTATGGAAGSGGQIGSRFPLTHQSGERFLREASGKPFFFNGDTSWSLIAQVTKEDAEQYLEDRRQKGFTVILVNLLEHEFSDKAPANIYGDAPFTTAGDFSKPNEAYFAHADWVLQKAEEKGLLVLLAPAYLGYGGGSEGFYQEMVASSAANLESYGKFLGQRYLAQPNILWLQGGDYDPPNQSVVESVVKGIRSVDTAHLTSAHTQRNEAASDVWGSATWLDVDNVYTGADSHGPSLALFAKTQKPFFLIEAYYEHEHSMTEEALRAQAYGALLGGAMGQLFGNNPMWCMSASTCLAATEAPSTWQADLDSRGSKDMAVLAKAFSGLAWEKLAPSSKLLATDSADGFAALATDGSFAWVYTQKAGSIEVDLSLFSGSVTVTRVDPTSGAEQALTTSPAANQGKQSFGVDKPNATGTDDWLVRLTTN
jgi:hypothetical protein